MSSANTAAAEKKDPGMGWRQFLRLILSLLLITASAALILSVVNTLTADTIAQRREAQRRDAMARAVPGANVFSELYSEDETIDRISGAYAGTRFMGYCVEVSPKGFAGSISLLVGVDRGGSVTGVVILDHGEDAGLGARANSPDFLEQYTGKSGTITVNQGGNAISAVTGATITSEAVTEGVNRALTAVLNYSAEGGQTPDEGKI